LKTAVVTGVAGFIGSHLAEKLLEDKIKVVGIDSFTNYYSKKIKKNNLINCLKNKNFNLIQNDLMKVELEPILKKTDYIFHHAAQPGVRSSWGTEFNTYVKNNILATQRLLEISKNLKSIKKIVIASSSSVYGNQKGIMSENSITKPESPYGATKLASENLGMIYHSNYNLPVICLRYFTVYGPRQRPDMAFTKFLLSGIRDKPLTIFGNGNQTRDFTFIDDIINANVLAMKSNITGEIINIGGGHVISVNNILKIIKNITGKNLETLHLEKQRGDVKHTEADISKAKKILNYKPKTKIENGINFEYRYLLDNLRLYE
jgi:nucleoside-diphosphate-sugar epimerase